MSVFCGFICLINRHDLQSRFELNISYLSIRFLLVAQSTVHDNIQTQLLSSLVHPKVVTSCTPSGYIYKMIPAPILIEGITSNEL